MLASDEHDWSMGDEEGNVCGAMGKRQQVRAGMDGHGDGGGAQVTHSLCRMNS